MKTLQEKGKTIREKLARIKEFRDEQDKLIEKLSCQAELMEEGVDPQQVSVVGCDRIITKSGEFIALDSKLVKRCRKCGVLA